MWLVQNVYWKEYIQFLNNYFKTRTVNVDANTPSPSTHKASVYPRVCKCWLKSAAPKIYQVRFPFDYQLKTVANVNPVFPLQLKAKGLQEKHAGTPNIEKI